MASVHSRAVVRMDTLEHYVKQTLTSVSVGRASMAQRVWTPLIPIRVPVLLATQERHVR
jgi:hypothetical protein